MSDGKAAANPLATSCRATRSCGRRGPARLGSTVARSRESVSENLGSGESGVRKSPCSFVYASTRATWSRSEEHTSELQSHVNLVCRLLLEKKNISLSG